MTTDRDQKFRKKPVVIEATQWFKNGDHPDDYTRPHEVFEDGELRQFAPNERKANAWEGDIVRYYRSPEVPGERECQHCGNTMREHGWIDTLEGGHIVCPGDWIITGIKGEFYPCKPDIFASTHEPAHAREAGAPEPVGEAHALGPVAWLGPYKDAITALNELRKSVAEIIGEDPETWPDHGNAPLAIAATLALARRTHPAPAQEPVAVPAGWKLVPTEPTPEMIDAWHRASWPTGPSVSPLSQQGLAFVRYYDAMLAAAPISPAADSGKSRLREAAEKCDEWVDEAPSADYDNGATADGWRMACRALEKQFRARIADLETEEGK